MGRPKKINNTNNINNEKQNQNSELPLHLQQPQEELTVKQVYDVMEFSKQMYNLYPGVFSPELVSSRMKDINMNPLAQTEENITTALSNPKNSEYQLRGLSEFFEYTNMTYKRTLGYLGNMLSFDYTFICTNADKSEMKSKKYKKDLNIVYDFLNKFDVKREFKKVVRMLVRQEAFFCTLRDDGEQFVLQELPMDYSKITGRWEYGYLFDFNMQYFLSNPGVSIDMYPDIFKEYFNRVIDAKSNGYNPANQIDERTGEWVLWVQTSPEDNMWAFKFNQEQSGLVPYLSPMFADLVNTPYIRALQKNKYIIEASKIMIGLVPFIKDSKNGMTKDNLALDPKTLGHFANIIRQALPDAIKFGIAPLEDVKQYDFTGNSVNIYEEFNKVTAATSGINSRLIFGVDKPNVEETRNSIGVDEFLMTYLYSYFNDFLNYHINKRTKEFKFKFKFEGTEFLLNRQTRLDNAIKLTTIGIVLPQKIAAAYGMEINELERQLDMGMTSDFFDKLNPLLTSYTLKSDDYKNDGIQPEDKKSGRPKTEDTGKPLSESAGITRDAGSNIGKGGEI